MAKRTLSAAVNSRLTATEPAPVVAVAVPPAPARPAVVADEPEAPAAADAPAPAPSPARSGGRAGKKAFSVYVTEDKFKRIRHLGVAQIKTNQELIDEALDDLLVKYSA